MFQIRSQLTSMSSSRANRSLAACAWRKELGEARRVEVTLIEQLLRRLHDRRHDARPADDAARGAHGAVPDPGRDLADLERELRRAGERVAPLVHRRRAGVRRLARPGDPPALDPVGAEHGPEREVHRLEHRALLDVELEVGGGALELRAVPRGRGRDRRRWRRAPRGARRRRWSFSSRSSSWSLIEPDAAEEPKSERPKRAPSSSAQLTSRTVTGAGPSSAIRRSTSAPATTLSAPSSQPPFGTESMWPPISTAGSLPPRSVHQSFPAASRSRSSGRPERSPSSQALAVFHVVRPGDALGAVLVAGQLLQLA